MNMGNNILKRTAIATAVSASLGCALTPQLASATTYIFSWDGFFTMIDSAGVPLENGSLAKGTNRFQTPITGTLTYDDTANTGTLTIDSFDFFNGTAPAVASGVTFSDTDGLGAGTLLLGNMLFDWNGNNGIPVSLAWDANGLQSYLAGSPTVGDTITGASPSGGAIPAADGSYTNATYSYLALGATPVATTAWNTTLATGCTTGVDGDFTNNVGGGCMGVNPNGALPLVTDTVANNNDFTANTGATAGTHDTNSDTFLTYYGIGGNPMADGPFQGFNANFDLVSLTLVDDGSGPPFSTPADLAPTVAEAATPTTATIDIGTVADEPGSTTVEYSTDGGSNWVADSGGVNNVTFDLTETVNSFTVDWKVYVTANPASVSLGSQTVEITITDTTNPTFTSFPGDISVNVTSTSDSVAFEGPTSTAGSVLADDATDPAPLIEYSINNTTNWTTETPAADETATTFGSGANTVYWRITDASGNITTQNQTVTLNLPSGIVGVPCTVDPDVFAATVGDRLLGGSFTMHDPSGGLVGAIDTAVSGSINTDPDKACADETCTVSGAALVSPTPFFGELWTTNTIRLFNTPGTYTFNTVQDGNPTLSMTVGPNQLGAHMLFDWSVNRDIDVVLVWDYSCGAAQLVTTDPDGDGIIGTKMVDGPFKGFSAAFDLATLAGEQALTSGGFSVTIPVVKNSVANTSPVALTPGTIGTTLGGVTLTATELFDTYGAATDGDVLRSCVGGCFDFSVSGLATGSTIQVVLPLSETIPSYSLYRKFDASSDTWRGFVYNTTDNVMTAALDSNGRCPEPGAGDYTPFTSGVLANMLRPGDQCVQLTITDGGPNDDDPADGVIGDPSGVGVTPSPAAPEAITSGGGCTISAQPMSPARAGDWLLIGGLLAGLGLYRRRQS